MKRGFALVLVFLLFASILSISLISANIFGTWFEKSNNSENPENANSNTITGAFSWFRSSAKCGDGKINRAGEQCDGSDFGGKICQSFGFSGGTLGCDPGCKVVTSGCTSAAPAAAAPTTTQPNTTSPATTLGTAPSGTGTSAAEPSTWTTTVSYSFISPVLTGHLIDYPRCSCDISPSSGNCVYAVPTESPGTICYDWGENDIREWSRKYLVLGGCHTILQNGPTSSKINIYFYDSGFDLNPEIFNSFVKNSYVFLFGNSTFPGIEPYKSLKQEFNVYSFRNDVDLVNCGPSSVTPEACHYDYVKNKLSASCSGFSTPSAPGESDGNYNIIILPIEGGNVYSGGSSSSKDIAPLVQAISAVDLIYIQLSQLEGYPFDLGSSIVAHELGHRIGFFSEEYGYFDNLNLVITAPNIDTAECKKWCQGANTQSACYSKYSQFVGCFKEKFINKLPELQSILNENNFDYNSLNIDWFGKCFDLQHTIPCGNKIKEIINPLTSQTNWLSDWKSCQNQFFGDSIQSAEGHSACNLGLNCQQGTGCYPQTNLAGFISTPQNSFIMGLPMVYSNRTSYGSYDEQKMRENILNKTRSIIVDYNPTLNSIKTCQQTRTWIRQTNPNLCAADETKTSARTYSECSGYLNLPYYSRGKIRWRQTCYSWQTYYDYSCVKTTQTQCSATAACTNGTTEKSSVACTI